MTRPDPIDFFFEFSSPYSYLAATQVDWLAAQTGARIVLKPMLLGVVFREHGISPPATIPAKGQYMFRDLMRWAAHYDVPLRWPETFPINSIMAHRVALVAQRDLDEAQALEVVQVIYRGYWGEGVDISDAGALTELLDGAGFDGESLVARTQDPDIKERLKECTAEAIERGVFGAPSFFVGEQLFWGNDRFDFIIAASASA